MIINSRITGSERTLMPYPADISHPLADAALDKLRTPANCNSSILLNDIDLTAEQLAADVADARAFLKELSETSTLIPENGLVNAVIADWAPKLVRRHGVAGAVIEKAGSRAFVKRRPENPSAFQAYVEKQLNEKAPLLFRVGFGPLKNTNHCGPLQEPDWAEYLTLIQLTRMMHGVAQVYPHGVKAEIVPDDLRTCGSNLCPASRTTKYISGLQAMVKSVGLSNAITVENGQRRLYARYNVQAYQEEAAAALNYWKEKDPSAFEAKWASSVENAGKNIYCAREKTTEEIESAAWRYLVAHRAEILSGLWSPGDAFPLRYANHVNSYQIYTFGFKKTKLPWQIALPLSLLKDAV
jgi:hypothetical protein